MMKEISPIVKKQSIESFMSTIQKCENALLQMTDKGSSTTLLTNRLIAFQIGLAILMFEWEQKPLQYTKVELTEAKKVLTGLLPSIENSFAKTRPGSPQHTLLERRMKSLQLALLALNSHCSD